MKIGKAPSVLAIIDDDKSVRSALQDLVESEGMSALCIGSAEQFLDSDARNSAACLIADIRMPGMSGLELQTRLKAERCRIPIIFITGRGDIPLAVSAMKEGACDFFTKPVERAALLRAIEKALQQDHRRRTGMRSAEWFRPSLCLSPGWLFWGSGNVIERGRRLYRSRQVDSWHGGATGVAYAWELQPLAQVQ